MKPPRHTVVGRLVAVGIVAAVHCGQQEDGELVWASPMWITHKP